MLSISSEKASDGGASTEEIDLLYRSKKKTKRNLWDREEEMTEGGIDAPPGFGFDMNFTPDEQENNATSPQPGNGPSFREALTGRKTVEGKKVEDVVSDDDAEEEGEGDEDCPNFWLTKEEKIRMRKPWQNTLIIKVLGRTVGYNYLLKRLRAIWKPKAAMDLVAIQNGYHLARFASVDDYEFAKLEGPWTVLDHCLAVKDWEPEFDPMTEATQKLLVWVRFPCLPIEYFDEEFLMRVGRAIGEPKKVDQTTSMASRGLFARVCVEVDVTKPLLVKYKVRNKLRTIEYEGLHLVCFKCGVVGHRKEDCKKAYMSQGDISPERGTGGLANGREEEPEKEGGHNRKGTENQGFNAEN